MKKLTRVLTNKELWWTNAWNTARLIAVEKGIDPESIGLIGITEDLKEAHFHCNKASKSIVVSI